jgi:hypothetical protein
MCATEIHPFNLSIIAQFAFSTASNSVICFTTENPQAFTSTASVKNRSESFRTMIRMRGVARETPKGRSKNKNAVVPRRLCFSAVDPALHERQKSLP